MYGRKSPGNTNSPTVQTTPRNVFVPKADNELCTDPKIDAIFNTADGSTFAFKGNKYYKLTENAIADGYPKLISEGWPGLTGN